MQLETSEESMSTVAIEPVWDCNQAARFLGLHPKTVKRMARAGEIPGCRLGRRWIFRPSELDALLRGRVSSRLRTIRAATRRGADTCCGVHGIPSSTAGSSANTLRAATYSSIGGGNGCRMADTGNALLNLALLRTSKLTRAPGERSSAGSWPLTQTIRKPKSRLSGGCWSDTWLRNCRTCGTPRAS